MVRTTRHSRETINKLLAKPILIQRELNNRSFYQFFRYFWPVYSTETLSDNWHIRYLCDKLQEVAVGVMLRQKKKKDLVINIPPGTTKTSIASIMFPVWCWTIDYSLRFICGSYSATLALESADHARDILRSEAFREMYPELAIKNDKDTKSNYRVSKLLRSPEKNWVDRARWATRVYGGNRYSTSVGGTTTGFHGHILIIDDPLNPHEQNSEAVLRKTNAWMDQVLSTRKVDKDVTVTILIMQRIHQKDPSGHLLDKAKANVEHICLPGELGEYEQYVSPKELKTKYQNGLLDANRLSRSVLQEMEADLGQYGYAGQVGQNPTPPGGGMFQVDMLQTIDSIAEYEIIKKVRFWDKAGTQGAGAFSSGVQMMKTKCNKYIILDVKRGQWRTEIREKIIRKTAERDTVKTSVYIEQEPGSGGKESAENTVRNLAGFSCTPHSPKGDKVLRADVFASQVNIGNVFLLRGAWNEAFIEEFRFFPFGRYKDQVDSASSAFAMLNKKKQVGVW